MGIVLDPTKCFASHPSEEFLEEYVFHRLPEVLTTQVEEHLLICHSCQDAVGETDGFVFDLKAADRDPDLVYHLRPRAKQPGWSWGLGPVLALAVLTLVMVLQKQVQEPFAPVAVSLSSLRGLDPLTSAPAGKPLQLNMNAPDLTSGKQYRVEVVDATGYTVWKGAATETDGKLVATMSKPLGRGVYWVRLYGADSELLREFGISAK
jgi:hypothetical protein